MQQANKSTIYILTLVIFIDTMTIGLVVPIFAALFNDPHGILPVATSQTSRNMYYTLLVSLPMFALLFGAPVLGELSDRFGRRPILLFSLLGVLFSCALSAVSLHIESVSLLFISRILVALWDGSESIAQASIVDMSTPDTKMLNMSLITLGSALGFVVGPLLGGVLSDSQLLSWFNYQAPFWVAAALGFINLILVWYRYNETSSQVVKTHGSLMGNFARLFLDFFNKCYWQLTVAFLALQFCWAGIFQTTNLVLAQYFHYSSAMLGVFSGYIGFVFTVALLGLLRLLKPIMRTLTMARFGYGIFPFSLLLLAAFAHQQWAIWSSIFISACAMALAYNTTLTLFSDAVTQEHQGRIMGLTSGLVAVAWLLSGIYCGHFISISYHVTFLGQALIGFIGAFVLLLYKNNEKQQ